jgi:hypothetical protein
MPLMMMMMMMMMILRNLSNFTGLCFHVTVQDTALVLLPQIIISHFSKLFDTYVGFGGKARRKETTGKIKA